MPSWPSASPLAQGVLYVPSDSGEPPSQVPDGISGYVPAIFNPLTESFWVYLNGAWLDLSGSGTSTGHRIFSIAADDTRSASIDLLGHFRTLLVGVVDSDDEGGCLQFCNGESWVTIAYANPRPRLHGPEAHVTGASGVLAQVLKETAADQGISDTVGVPVQWSDGSTGFPMAANDVWRFYFDVFYDGHASDDFKLGLVATGGGTGRWALTAASTAVAAASNTTMRTGSSTIFTVSPVDFQGCGHIGAGTGLPARIFGRVRATASGTLQLWYGRSSNTTGNAGQGTAGRILAFTQMTAQQL